LFENVKNIIDNIIMDSIKKEDIYTKKEFNNIKKRCNHNIQGKYTNILMDYYGKEVYIEGNKYFELNNLLRVILNIYK